MVGPYQNVLAIVEYQGILALNFEAACSTAPMPTGFKQRDLMARLNCTDGRTQTRPASANNCYLGRGFVSHCRIAKKRFRADRGLGLSMPTKVCEAV